VFATHFRRDWGIADSPTMRTFHATTEGQNRLGLPELLERYAKGPWVAYPNGIQVGEPRL